MPANLKDLRNRIKSVKSNQKITKAMQLVSAAKFGRAQMSVIQARPYAFELAKLLKHLAYFVRGGCALPLLTPNESKHALVVVVSSERGLCGGYNANVIKQVNKTWEALKAEGYSVSFTCIGKKAFQSLLRKKSLEKGSDVENPSPIAEEDYITNPNVILNASALSLITTPFEKQLNQSIEPLAEALSALYAQGKISKLMVVYSRFQSAMVQTPITKTILPFSNESQSQGHDVQGAPNPTVKTTGVTTDEKFLAEPIFEPERDELLAMALPRYMSSQIFHMLLEARASEYGARMTAMDNATRNAKEIEKKLQITYQRARQAAITNELIEIISGAEAL